MSRATESEKLRRHFELFAAAVEHLPLYHRLAVAIVDDPPVRDLLLAAQPGQARPILLLAAVHDLLLRNPDLAAARWYRSITPETELAPGDPYPAVRAAILDHAGELREVIATHSTQTNEVNRCALLAPLLAAALADDTERPVALLELGCSAGLLLGLDHYRLDVGGEVVGDPRSEVRLAARLVDGVAPSLHAFPVAGRVATRAGVDLSPISLDDTDRVRWLEACLWPDQPYRVERFRSAVRCMRTDPPHVVAGDLIDALPTAAALAPPDAHLVVFHGWALTYVARERRPALAAAIAGLASQRDAVSWLSLEAPNVVPGIEAPELPEGFEESQPETVLGLRRWRRGTEQDPVCCGWAHPHGDWLTWESSGSGAPSAVAG